MLGYIKDNFLYIKCPKNGCMTYSTFLERNGWSEVNIFENSLNFDQLTMWGHLTDPHNRHTKGVEQYIRINKDCDITNPIVAKMLVSAVFDEHTYSINMMLGKYLHYPIKWIPLDADIVKYNAYPMPIQTLTGDDLTNDFFKEHGINLTITNADRKNVTSDKTTRHIIQELKQTYYANYQKLVKNFLEPDLILYANVVNEYRKKYELRI